MKKILVLVSLIVLVLAVSCKAQPKADYEIYSNSVSTAAQYHFFLEKKSANPYRLTQGMDYLSPDVTALQVGVSTDPSLTINLDNDGSEYRIGVVAVNDSGYYSGMGVKTVV